MRLLGARYILYHAHDLNNIHEAMASEDCLRIHAGNLFEIVFQPNVKGIGNAGSEGTLGLQSYLISSLGANVILP